jgi:uncharacterized membrane protein
MVAETMGNPAYANPEVLLGGRGNSWTAAQQAPAIRRSLFGDLMVITFLLAQCFDGVFTYVGVMMYGVGIEANPLLASLMTAFGYGVALTVAKVLAAGLGICLHLRGVHGAVAALAGFYLLVAIVPWTIILFA